MPCLRPAAPYRWGFFASIVDWFLSSILVAAIAAFLRVGFYFPMIENELRHFRSQVAAEVGRLAISMVWLRR